MDKFISYFDNRYHEVLQKGDMAACGPIITLSRQTGCDAIATAKRLVNILNDKYNTNKWHWVDKQVLTDAARRLKTDQGRVENSMKGTGFSGMSEMIMAISGEYLSDIRIKKAVRDVILSICNEGHAILVGRGGVSITRGIRRALHIRLVAPFYWRVENIIKKRQYGIEDAEEFVVDTDEKRHNIIINFLDKKPLNIDYLFDATINRSSYTVDQIADLIFHHYDIRMKRIKSEGDNPARDLNSSYG